MPIRRVPWEKAGIAATAKRPIPTTATQRRLNIPCSTVRRLLEGAWAQNMQAPSQGGRLQQAWDSEALSARVIAGGEGWAPKHLVLAKPPPPLPLLRNGPHPLPPLRGGEGL